MTPIPERCSALMTTTIMVADKAGACFGVERALELVRRTAHDAKGPVHTLGPLIHNPQVVEALSREGVSPVTDPEEARPGSTLVMRAHGVTPQVEHRAQGAGLITVDATCPYVKKVHVAVERLQKKGYEVLVVGEKGHPEVEGICGHASNARVVGSAADVASLEVGRRVGLVAQTTLERSVLRSVVCEFVGRCEELLVIDTICSATRERQEAAADLASRVDVMIVVGGRGSANTRHLADVCRAQCGCTYHVELADELDSSWFDGASAVGITAGASTPATQINEVRARVEALCS